MSTLFERVAGIVEDEKIPVHIFMGIIHEFQRGRVTGAQAKAVLGLTDQQAGDAAWLVNAINTSPNPELTKMTIKNHVYMSEWRGTKQYFRDEAAFYQKIQDEITQLGGTPPGRA